MVRRSSGILAPGEREPSSVSWAAADLNEMTPVSAPTVSVEAAIGRALAWCVRPYATWRTQSATARLIVWSAYCIAGYLAVLCVLAFSFAG